MMWCRTGACAASIALLGTGPAMAAQPEGDAAVEYEIDEVEEVPQAPAEPPDAVTPDAVTPDAETLDAETPDAVTPDAVTPDAASLGVAEAADATLDGEPEVAEPQASQVAAESPPAASLASEENDERTAAQSLRAFADHLRVGGFVQVDFLWRQISEDELSDGTREPLNETGFHLRNARLGLNADWRYFGVTAYADFFSNGGPVRPVNFDAHAQLPGKKNAPPLVQLRAGLLRVPFGFENYNQNDVQRFFGERATMMNAYVPGLFDIGASLGGHVWAVDWIVGVYNGQPLGAPGFGYRDPNAAKDFAGRLQLGGHLVGWLDASVGFSFLYGKGFSAGTGPTKDTFDWVDLNEDGRVTVPELIPIAGSAGRASENFRRWGLAGDIQIRSEIPKLGQLMLYSEVAAGSNLDRAVAIADPVLLGRDQRGIGWYAGLTQALTKHAGIGIRYDQYYPNRDALEAYGGLTVNTRRKFDTIAAGVAGYLHQGERARARLLLEYEHQGNTLGRSAQGRPDQLDNDTFRVRTEVAF